MDGGSLKVLLGKGWTLEQIGAHFEEPGPATQPAVRRAGERRGRGDGGPAVRASRRTRVRARGASHFRCKRCRVDAINRRRREVKAILVAQAGGRCCVRGYDGHPAALEFHHLDPSLKRLNVSASGVGLALETLRAEARKCVLLCSNSTPRWSTAVARCR